jgi:hypothetical protein
MSPTGDYISQGDAANRIDTSVTKLKTPVPEFRCVRSTTSPRWIVVTNARTDGGAGCVTNIADCVESTREHAVETRRFT